MAANVEGMTRPVTFAVIRFTRWLAGLGTLCTVAFVVTGCLAHSPQARQASCTPVADELAAGTTADSLAGEYLLTLVATKGKDTGRVAEGQLWLNVNDSALRHVTTPAGRPVPGSVAPLYGATDIDLDVIGAIRVGDITSLDPLLPGVLVLERHVVSQDIAFSEIFLRLGSEANRRDRIRFDGAYTALRVRRIAVDGFDGSWASGITGSQSEGFFCARRIKDQ